MITIIQHQHNGFAWQHPETPRNKPLSFIPFLEVGKVRPRCVHSPLCKYRTRQGSDTGSHSSAVLCRQHLLLPPALQDWWGNKSLTTGIKFSPRARKSKSNLKDEWKTQHWWGGVFPHWKKKTHRIFLSKSSVQQKKSKKSRQALSCCCFADVNYCRTRRMRLFRHNQPAARRHPSNLSACCKKLRAGTW